MQRNPLRLTSKQFFLFNQLIGEEYSAQIDYQIEETDEPLYATLDLLFLALLINKSCFLPIAEQTFKQSVLNEQQNNLLVKYYDSCREQLLQDQIIAVDSSNQFGLIQFIATHHLIANTPGQERIIPFKPYLGALTYNIVSDNPDDYAVPTAPAQNKNNDPLYILNNWLGEQKAKEDREKINTWLDECNQVMDDSDDSLPYPSPYQTSIPLFNGCDDKTTNDIFTEPFFVTLPSIKK